MKTVSEGSSKVKIYDTVYQLLVDHPKLRDSDRLLIWNVWGSTGFLSPFVETTMITRNTFMQAPSTESIRRCRQKIQELHPELRSSKPVQEAKDAIADQKGTHIYREEI